MNADKAFERAKSEFLAGLACQQSHDHAQAERHYLASLAHLPGRPSTLVNLAATQLQLGRPVQALANADAALASEPDSPDALLHRGSALAQLGRPAEALAGFERLIALAPDLAVAWTHRGSLLRELGRLDDAAASFDEALRLGADPELHHYYLGALGRGAMPPAPPRQYVERLFDGYADDFDDHLVGQLGYRAHTELLGRVRRAAPGTVFEHALDLGCGTGLCGPLMRPIARRLTGLDLSARMLERSRSRAVYDTLVQADAVAHLQQTAERHDLVVAADVLIYLGDPKPLLAALQHMPPQGLLAFTAEWLQAGEDPQGWQLMPSLRYAHARTALLREAATHGFEPLIVEAGPVRNDQSAEVQGLYLVLQRR